MVGTNKDRSYARETAVCVLLKPKVVAGTICHSLFVIVRTVIYVVLEVSWVLGPVVHG